jgi:hypothetical protein
MTTGRPEPSVRDAPGEDVGCRLYVCLSRRLMTNIALLLWLTCQQRQSPIGHAEQAERRRNFNDSRGFLHTALGIPTWRIRLDSRGYHPSPELAGLVPRYQGIEQK